MHARDEKNLDTSIGSVQLRINELKEAISSMIFKIEHDGDSLNWPGLLDNFALLSGHLTSVSKSLSAEKVPLLRNFSVLPLLITPVRDELLVQMTEGRISTFAHDLVPDYLRTKPDPLVEQKIASYEPKAGNLTYDTQQKQVAQFGKIINHIHEIADKAKQEWESETSSRTSQPATSSTVDTHVLVYAIGSGKGLKSENVPMVQPVLNQANNNLMGMGRSPAGQPSGSVPGQMVGQMNKAVSSIKTNIKAASTMAPYDRR
ncbi:hypothetical protein TKK_0007525 [Trichogramma kaykai]|uniref:Mediator of RNA polymerase II transcription subunit 8 n=1 Tax=Trichogramma kaykai TaxID=54128 RepID=A0ABD2WGC5_9HYME